MTELSVLSQEMKQVTSLCVCPGQGSCLGIAHMDGQRSGLDSFPHVLLVSTSPVEACLACLGALTCLVYNLSARD